MFKLGSTRKTLGLAGAVLSILALAAPAAAQATPGAPSGNGVLPQVVDGNPDCSDLGFDFGFKVDGGPNGTFSFTSADGSLTGGAPEDPGHTLTLSNSDGTYFDWSSTLGLDAVIVKGGPNANVFGYATESFGDTALHPPINPNNGDPYAISHIEVCYDYEVTVEKSATTHFTRTWHWSIDKSVSPASWALFSGDSGTSRYAVSVTRTGSTDSDWSVSGGISIANETPFDAMVTGVGDQISGGITPSLDCGVSFPYLLAAGDTLSCTYESALPDGSTRSNTATVTTTGVVGGGEAHAAVVFGDPTTQVDAEVHVVDSNGGSWGPVSDSATWTYDVIFRCDGDEGGHRNVATIVETGQSDDATVGVACYDLSVSKDAATDYTRTWIWDAVKSADVSELTLAPGQTYQVSYQVAVSAVASDSDWAVSGAITIVNHHPSAPAPLLAVSDLVSGGVSASVSCPASSVPAGGSLVCTYEAALPDGSERTNTATATLQNVSIAADGTVTAAGSTDFSSPAVAVTFGAPGSELDECIDLGDSLYGPLGAVCADQAPTTLSYSLQVGPFEAPDECGENEVTNTVDFTAGDTGATGEDSWTVTVQVPCDVGCTLTPGYWKTHSTHGPAPYDDTWAELPGGADTAFFASGQSWYEMLWTPPRGNAYYILGHAYAAASLNLLAGASAPPEVVDAWSEATDLFETWTPAEIGALKGNKPPRPRFLELAGVLDMYNNGLLGPGHCSEDSSSAR